MIYVSINQLNKLNPNELSTYHVNLTLDIINIFECKWVRISIGKYEYI